jgi:hypothetical protein
MKRISMCRMTAFSSELPHNTGDGHASGHEGETPPHELGHAVIEYEGVAAGNTSVSERSSSSSTPTPCDRD